MSNFDQYLRDNPMPTDTINDEHYVEIERRFEMPKKLDLMVNQGGLWEEKDANEVKELLLWQGKRIRELEKENEQLKQSEQEFREYCNYLKSILEDAELLYD